MKFADLLRLYEIRKDRYGPRTYEHLSELLREAKGIHKRDWLRSPTPNADHEQSWRAFKGKNLEKLVMYIIKDEIENLGLKIVDGNSLERRNSTSLSEELNRVKRNLLIDFGEFGAHLPDVDMIVYDPQSCEIIAVISSKVTLRERIAQTGYWKIKLSQDKVTEHIKVFLLLPMKMEH